MLCRFPLLLCLLYCVALQVAGQAPSGQPNIVVVVVDDAGLMDFSAYGGDIQTPNIDRLAERGVLFTRYHTSPLCAPSRAMLLTGMDNHLAGMATIPEVLPPEQAGKPGYSLRLEPGVNTLADHLRAAGYRTLMTGKWHLGHGDGELPADHGFDRSFALDASGADNYSQKPYMPYYSEAPWFEDGASATLPEDFYSSEFIVDRMLDYIADGPAHRPFFAYLGFQAIHIPLQAPPEFTAQYMDNYRDGWSKLREQRWRQAQLNGLIPANAPLAPMPVGTRDWDALDTEQKALWSSRMAVNAGMMTAMDHHLGRFVAELRERGEYDNTVFVVVSDNGPEPTRADDDWRMRLWLATQGYHLDVEGVGERGSYAFIGPEWATATASPSNLFKFYASEGGVRVPMIIAGPGIPQARRSDAFTLVSDITPTLLELVGAAGGVNGRPMTGRSLLPLLTGISDQVYADDEPVGLEVSGNSALYSGDWKLLRNLAPYGDGEWRLFNLGLDPGETRDLSSEHPAVFESLKAAYARYEQAVGVQPMPDSYSSERQLSANVLKKSLAFYGPQLLTIVGVLLALLFTSFLVRRRLRSSLH